MSNWFTKLFFKKPQPPKIPIVILEGSPAHPKLTQAEAEILSHYKCPDCGGDLYEGPCGGMTMNVRCDKGHRFNVTNPEIAGVLCMGKEMTPFICERI